MSEKVEIKVNVDEARMEAVRKAREEEGLTANFVSAFEPGTSDKQTGGYVTTNTSCTNPIDYGDTDYAPKMQKPTYTLTAAEKKELTNRFGGMSKEEIDFIIDLIPIEYCLDRIHRELDKAKDFENKVKSAMASLG